MMNDLATWTGRRGRLELDYQDSGAGIKDACVGARVWLEIGLALVVGSAALPPGLALLDLSGDRTPQTRASSAHFSFSVGYTVLQSLMPVGIVQSYVCRLDQELEHNSPVSNQQSPLSRHPHELFETYTRAIHPCLHHHHPPLATSGISFHLYISSLPLPNYTSPRTLNHPSFRILHLLVQNVCF
jgi:hypothetical protein